MKRIIILFLLLDILLQSFSKLVIMLNYQVNKEYIAAFLCINKDKPEMNCEGKCQLAKQIQEEEKRESSPVNPLKEKFEIQLYSQADEILAIHSQLIRTFTFSPFYISETASYCFSIFHPPRLTA